MNSFLLQMYIQMLRIRICDKKTFNKQNTYKRFEILKKKLNILLQNQVNTKIYQRTYNFLLQKKCAQTTTLGSSKWQTIQMRPKQVAIVTKLLCQTLPNSKNYIAARYLIWLDLYFCLGFENRINWLYGWLILDESFIISADFFLL